MRALPLALVLVAFVGPAAAYHPPVLAETASDGWVSIRVRTDGEPAYLDYAFDARGHDFAWGYRAYDVATGRIVAGYLVGSPTDGVALRARAPEAGVDVAVGERQVRTDDADGGFSIRTPGTYDVLFWGAGDEVNVSLTLSGYAGVEALAADAGNRTFTFGWLDFDGRAHASSVVGHATYEGRAAFDVVEALHGRVDRSGYGLDSLRVDGPHGSRSCPCDFRGAPAGAYAIRWTGVGVQGPFVVLADASLG